MPQAYYKVIELLDRIVRKVIEKTPHYQALRAERDTISTEKDDLSAQIKKERGQFSLATKLLQVGIREAEEKTRTQEQLLKQSKRKSEVEKQLLLKRIEEGNEAARRLIVAQEILVNRTKRIPYIAAQMLVKFIQSPPTHQLKPAAIFYLGREGYRLAEGFTEGETPLRLQEAIQKNNRVQERLTAYGNAQLNFDGKIVLLHSYEADREVVTIAYITEKGNRTIRKMRDRIAKKILNSRRQPKPATGGLEQLTNP